MQRAQYSERGPQPQASIQVVDFELPATGPGQARVRVLAAPINPSDVLTLTGEYGMLPPLPAIGGNEGVGRIEELGAGVERLQVGQTVLLPPGSGTWSSHLLLDAARLVPLPEGADPRQLAMLTVNPPTAALLLSEFVSLAPGDWVIQNAANSAVGGYLMQLARLRGYRSINVVRRASALAALEAQAGADTVLLVDGDDLPQRVAAITGDSRPRLAIDAVGGMATERLARCLEAGGTLVNYGAMGGEPCSISPHALIFRNIALRGFWLALWFRQAAPQRQQQVFGELAGLIAQGRLSARIQASYPLARIKEAVAAAAAGGREGKIIVEP